jgi:hypothetical protein
MILTINVGRAAVLVCHDPEEKCTQRPHSQGQEECGGNRRDIRVEFLRDVLQDKNNNEEIERIQSPPKEARQHRVPLIGGQNFEIAENRHDDD